MGFCGPNRANVPLLRLSLMARTSVTSLPETHVSGASDTSLNASYVGAIAVTGSTLAVGACVAGAPVVGAFGGLALASGLAYSGYCSDNDLNPLAPWGDDDSSSEIPESTDATVVA